MTHARRQIQGLRFWGLRVVRSGALGVGAQGSALRARDRILAKRAKYGIIGNRVSLKEPIVVLVSS